jgi:hypothetical protein
MVSVASRLGGSRLCLIMPRPRLVHHQPTPVINHRRPWCPAF